MRYVSCVGGFRYPRRASSIRHVGRPRREPADLGGHREVVAHRVMLGDRVVDGEAIVTGASFDRLN